jgi:hypothetical protein
MRTPMMTEHMICDRLNMTVLSCSPRLGIDQA